MEYKTVVIEVIMWSMRVQVCDWEFSSISQYSLRLVVCYFIKLRTSDKISNFCATLFATRHWGFGSISATRILLEQQTMIATDNRAWAALRLLTKVRSCWVTDRRSTTATVSTLASIMNIRLLTWLPTCACVFDIYLNISNTFQLGYKWIFVSKHFQQKS